MLKRLSHKDTPADLQDLVSQLRERGDCVVIEDEHHRPIAYLTLEPIIEKLDREDWAQIAQAGLSGAYGDQDPDYSSF